MHIIKYYLQNQHNALSTTQILKLTSNQDFDFAGVTSSNVRCVALIKPCVRLAERGKLKTCIFMNQTTVLVPADNWLRIAARRTLYSKRITDKNKWRTDTVYYRGWLCENKVKKI